MARGQQPAEPQWLAKPSGACCLKGHLHSGEPKGTFDRVSDIDTYVSKPEPSKANGHIVLYYPDVFGFFTNGLLVMDSFAEAGYLTIGIDYFSGVSCFPKIMRPVLDQLSMQETNGHPTGSHLHAPRWSKYTSRRIRLREVASEA